MRCAFIVIVMIFSIVVSHAQDANELVKKVREKLDRVTDYKAQGKLKTDVAFLKVPVSNINVFYKKPNRFRIKKDGGISLLPKGGVSISVNSLVTSGEYVAVDAGGTTMNAVALKIVKLLPLNENSDVVLMTLYINQASLLIQKATTTTRENGTYDLEMYYGKFAEWGLPDKLIFSFNTKDYKIPKGVTFEYEAGEKQNANEDKLKNKKGKVEITYSSYLINQGLPDAVFE
jgi:outer membrane lipoprotein-sorting protein